MVLVANVAMLVKQLSVVHGFAAILSTYSQVLPMGL